MSRPAAAVRVAPRPLLGLAAFAAYIIVIIAVQGTSGVPVDELGDSAGNLWRSGVLSIALASAVVAGLATWWGWWRLALTERVTTSRRWTIIAPALIAVHTVGTLLYTGWSDIGTDFIVAGVAVGLLVGFGEEFTTRGMLLVGLRGRLREVLVWLFTCLAFGLMHSVNVLLGAAADSTGQQIIFAGISGSAFYILRRVTGSLIWAMLLHGLWDFSIFAHGISGTQNPLSLVYLAALALSVVFGFLATKDASPSTAHEEPAAPARS